MVAGIQPGQAQNLRTFGELFVRCEIQEMASRIGAAVMLIFQAIAELFQDIGRFILNGCSLENRVLPNPADQEEEQRNAFVAELTEIIADIGVWVIPIDERETILAQVLPLINEEMNRWDKRDIIEKIAEIPTQEREAVIRLSLLFITQEMDAWSIKNVIDTVVEVPAEDREVVIPLARQLTEGMDAWSVRNFLHAVVAVPAEEREVIIPLTRQLITGEMQRWDRQNILEAVTAIPAQERETVIPLARQLITEEMDGMLIRNIIQEIVAIQPQERETVITQARLVITEEMDRWDRRDVIEAVTAIPAREREAVILLARQLITEGMDGRSARALIELVTAIPAQERETLIAQALLLITEDMNRLDRQVIIEAVTAVPAGQRVDVTRRALDLITPEMGAFARTGIIRNIVAVAANARANFVINRGLGIQDPPPVVNPNINFANGIDVHDGDRDQRTYAAMATLCRHQGPYNAQTIAQAMDNFVAYLDASVAFNAEQKQLARDALLSPEGAFAPLIDAQYFLPGGLRLTGTELIGRLWIFASGLNGNDQFIAKDGMIAALKNSYDDWGRRVCNGGKGQRLVVAVLQGRLAGVDIEGGAALQVTTEQAVEMFFNVEARRLIDTLQALLVTANQFCDENPNVNRDDFIREIEAYADGMGIV